MYESRFPRTQFTKLVYKKTNFNSSAQAVTNRVHLAVLLSPKQTQGHLATFAGGSSQLIVRVGRPQLYPPGPFDGTVAPRSHLSAYGLFQPPDRGRGRV